VVVVLFVGVVLLTACTWGLICLMRPRPRQRYSLIDDNEDGIRGKLSASIINDINGKSKNEKIRKTVRGTNETCMLIG